MIELHPTYGKLINGALIVAPTEKDGVYNYNLQTDILIADGYKLVKYSNQPSITAKKTWVETDSELTQVWKNNIISKLEFLNRFTDLELAAIYTAVKTNVQIEVWMEKFKLAEFLDLEFEQTITGVHGLELMGLIGEGRAGEILMVS